MDYVFKVYIANIGSNNQLNWRTPQYDHFKKKENPC